MSNDQFWVDVRTALDAAEKARTADELIAAVKLGPDQDAGSGDAFFAGSGGDDQLSSALENSDHWDVVPIEGDYRWVATSKVDGSVVEYIEGDLYRQVR